MIIRLSKAEAEDALWEALVAAFTAGDLSRARLIEARLEDLERQTEEQFARSLAEASAA